MAEIKNTFGVINSDTDPQLIENGDYQYALNIRNSGSTGGQIGSIEPVAGSEKKNFPLPSGVNTCIGEYSDVEENTIYFWIHNSQGQHQILRYFYELENFQVVINHPELNFSLSHRIVEAQRIGGQLFYNDARREVKRLDIAECLTFRDAQIWEFGDTLAPNLSGGVSLSGSTPPPFNVGDQITIIRNWRDAWLDETESSSGNGFILFPTTTSSGTLTAFYINDVHQIDGSIPLSAGQDEQFVQDIADAINNFTPVSGPDFTAYVSPDNPLMLIIVAPEGTSSDYNGSNIWIFISGGGGSIMNYTIQNIFDDDFISCKTALYHNYDPNPQYSGTHTVAEINGNEVVLSASPTGIQDEISFGGNESFIGGVAYLNSNARKFNLPFKEDFIKLYRPNPPFTVYAKYGSDESKKTNNLRGSLYQFKTRYVYANGMRSVPSPISKIPTPTFFKNLAFQITEVWRDNFINLWFDTGGYDVVAIELLVRETSNPTNQDWSVLDTIDKKSKNVRSNTSYQFKFYGDEVRVSIPIVEATQPMDYIPHVGHAFCFIRDKRNAIGGNDEGFDHVDTITTVDAVDCSDSSSSAAVLFREWPEGDNFTLGTLITDESLPQSRSIFFPLNKNFDTDDEGYIFGTLGSRVLFPFWRYRQVGSDENDFIFSSIGGNIGGLFADGWEYSYDSPRRINHNVDFPSSGYTPYIFDYENYGSYPWMPLAFIFYNKPTAYTNLLPATSVPVGTVISILIKYRVSKALIWCDRIDGGTPDQAQLYWHQVPGAGNWDTYNGFLAFETLHNSSQNGWHEVEVLLTKIVEEGETAQDVRNYFYNQVETHPSLNREYDVKFGVMNGPLPNFAKSIKNARVRISLDASNSNNGIGSGAAPETQFISNLYIRPRVEVLSIDGGSGSFESNSGVKIDDVRNWYRLVGFNKLSTKASVSKPGNSLSFKTGAKHLLAIEYRDSVGRRATVSPMEIKYIPYFNESNGIGQYNISLLVKIFSNAPSWATHWQMMYAGNMSMQKWVQFEVNWVDASASADSIRIALSKRMVRYNNAVNTGGVSALSDITGRSDVSYSWSLGDRMRFISFWGGSQEDESGSSPSENIIANQFIDVEILGEATDSTQGLVLIVNKNEVAPYVDGGVFGSGTFVEVYTPKDSFSEDQLLYKEIGEVFEVNSGNHRGNRLNQGGNTPGSNSDYAEVILNEVGDTYAIPRSALPIEDVNRSMERIVESQWFSDFFPSTGWGGGVANRYNREAKRELKKELIRYSDFLIGNRNGLNRYFDGNVSDEPDVIHGLIQRMECPDSDLYIFQELNTGITTIRSQELTTANGVSNIMRSDNVIGSIRYVSGDFGIGEHRESLTTWGGIFYYVSAANGMILKLAGSQFTPISKHKKDDYWNRVLEMVKQSNSKVIIQTAFDPKYGELIVHVPRFYLGIPKQGDKPDFLGVTVAYSEQKQGWVTEYKFNPEVMGYHNNKLVSWKGGQLYLHDKTDKWNQFYDDEPAQDSKIKLVFNQRPQAIKFLQGVGVMMGDAVVEPKEVVITSPYKGGQRTSLFSGDFEYQEDQFFAAVWQNELTPGVDEPIINGDDMRGQYFIVELTFGAENKFELFAVSLEHKNSEHTIKAT